VADVQVTIRFWRKARDDLGVLMGIDVSSDDLAYEI
jgi:hypothetical protein